MKNGLHIDSIGNKRWIKNGKFHREDGPAVIYKNGTQRWYLNGKFITSNENKFKSYMIQRNLKTLL